MIDELSYFGGLIDGEGCFTVCKARNKAYSPVFALASTSDVIILFIATVLEKNNILFSISRFDRKDNSKPFRTVRIQGSKALIKFILLMKPYILEKRPQAELLEQFIEIRSRYAKNNMQWNETDDVVSSLRKLNKRGIV